MAGGIVPGKINARKLLAVPILGHYVVAIEHVEEVLGMLFANILHAKIIHDKDKLDGLPCVFPQSRSGGRFMVSGGVQSITEEVVREFARLRETIGTADNFKEYPTVVHEGGVGVEVVFVPEFLGYVGVPDLDVFLAGHFRGLEIEVSSIKAHELGALS
jgi:hypothetical protein